MGRLNVRCVPCVDPEQSLRNVRYATGLGLTHVETKERPPLMVLGGGFSIRDKVDEVRESTSDKWIVGSAFRWWKDQGIDGTFFSVHPSPAALDNIHGVKRAILATQTDPGVFERLKGEQLEVFDLEDLKGAHGATSVTCVPMLAISMGYRDISFYGCEGNYGEKTHLYMSTDDKFMLSVKCAGEDFLTGAEFLMQSEFLAAALKNFPTMLKDKSGGLLGAMLIDSEYDVTHLSRTLHDSLEITNV